MRSRSYRGKASAFDFFSFLFSLQLCALGIYLIMASRHMGGKICLEGFLGAWGWCWCWCWGGVGGLVSQSVS